MWNSSEGAAVGSSAVSLLQGPGFDSVTFSLSGLPSGLVFGPGELCKLSSACDVFS